jgi:hypothetical protein
MLIALAFAGLALRSGLGLRRGRLGRAPRKGGARRAHLRVAKPAVALVALGFLGGLGSAVWLRGWSVFGTFHAILALAVLALFGAAAAVGHRIEEGRSRAFDTHAQLAGLAVLLAAVAAVAGFVLLP